MAAQKDEACEASNEMKHCVQGDEEGTVKSEISAARVSTELDLELFSADRKHETGMQSSDGIASAQPTPVKSDISIEIGLPLSSGTFEMDARKMHNLSAAEDGLNVRGHDPQQRTESSCSNSLSTILPVTFPCHTCQETSKETSSFRNCTDSANTKGFDCRLEEPLIASSELGACHQHENLSISHSVERTMHFEISEESKVTLTEKAKRLEMGPEVIDNIKGDSWENEASESSMTKPGNVTMENQDAYVTGFDLNEDINANEIDDYAQPPAATVSSQRVIQVVAKAGRPNGLPKIPLRFEGRLDWKGTAETSAFRPAGLSMTSERKSCLRNKDQKDSQGFTGIDLNIAAAEENSANVMTVEHHGLSSPPLQEAGSKGCKSRPIIDLNCFYDAAADEFAQPSLPPESGNPPLVDLNTNGNAPIGDKSNTLHWKNLDHLPLGNNTDFANPRRHHFNFVGQEYFSNPHIPVAVPNSLQPVEFLQRRASSQPKLPFGPLTLNLQGYPSNVPQHFVSGEPLPSSIHFSGTVPYARYSHEQGIHVHPGLLNLGTVHTSLYTPHLVQIVHEQGPGNIAASVPNLDVRTEDNLSTRRIKTDEVRQFVYIATNPPMGERVHQDTWYDASLKRKEPEGGFRHYQLGYN